MFRKYFTLLIGIKLCFDIRRKCVLQILFVFIFKYKNCRLNYFIQYPTFIKEIIKIAHHK